MQNFGSDINGLKRATLRYDPSICAYQQQAVKESPVPDDTSHQTRVITLTVHFTILGFEPVLVAGNPGHNRMVQMVQTNRVQAKIDKNPQQ